MTNPYNIKLLILDVDGVLTDGSLIINADGVETKAFNTLDGHGIRLLKRAGIKVAFLSGRFSEPTQRRADQLDIDYCLQDCHDKLDGLEKMMNHFDLKPENIACAGDDLPDLPVIKRVALGIAVANAVDEVKQHADLITKNTGGNGAVREIVEYILKKAGKWDNLMQRYNK